MSVMFDPETAIYPFPAKPQPLTVDEKQFYREKSSAAARARRRDGGALLHRSRNSTAGGRDRRLYRRLAGDGALWRPSFSLHAAGRRGAFYGETAKILSPEKTILMPTLNAECSLDLGCPIEEFNAFCDAHPNRTVVVYANTSAAVKARADWVVTSSIAVELIDHLDSLGQKILWAPDRHLGRYVQRQTGADVLCWQGACIVHDEFKTQALTRMKALHPEAAVLVHPESPQAIVEMADAVGSTSQLIAAAKSLPQRQLIVATDRGIFYKMQQTVPEKHCWKRLPLAKGRPAAAARTARGWR